MTIYKTENHIYKLKRTKSGGAYITKEFTADGLHKWREGVLYNETGIVLSIGAGQ